MSKLLNGSTGDIVALATLAVLYLGGVGLALWRIRAAAPRGKLYWIVCIALLAGGAVAITQNLSPEHDHGKCRPVSRSASKRYCSGSHSLPPVALG